MSKGAFNSGLPENNMPAVALGAVQVIAFDTTNKLSTAVPVGVTMARLVATQDCFVASGAAPDVTVAAQASPLAGGAGSFGGSEVLQVTEGQFIAVKQSSAAGSLYITWCL